MSDGIQANQLAEHIKAMLDVVASCEADDELTADELDPDGLLYESDARSFEERMILTSDAGLVLRLEDGSEFQITIVRSN